MRRHMLLIVLLVLFGLGISNSYGALTISPASKDFGSVAVGSGSTFTFVISNTGSTDVTISGASVQGDTTSFKLKETTCAGELTHGHTCTADVTFSPVSPGLKSAQVQVVSKGGSATANLSGTGACAYTLSPTWATSIGYCGGSGMSVTVATQSGCNWTALSNVSWATVTSGSSGVGGGTVVYRVEKNYDPHPRSGTMTIAGKTFPLAQAGCPNVISPTSASYGASGGTGSVNVTPGAECCVWDAVSNDSTWITITNVTGRPSSSGTVSYTVSANTGLTPRTGTLTIAGWTFTVSQAAAPPACLFSIAPQNASLGGSGGGGSVAVTPGASCQTGQMAWAALSNDSWITITSGNTGTGSGTVNYWVAANPGPGSRIGTLTIAGQTFTVNQAGPTSQCTYTLEVKINPPGAGTVTKTPDKASYCEGETVMLTAIPNAGYAFERWNGVDWNYGTTILLTMKGSLTVTSTFGSLCSLSISPETRQHESKTGAGSISVILSGGCSWNAQSNDEWIAIDSGSERGRGSGTVNYSILANPSPKPRTGTITISGATFTATQSGSASGQGPDLTGKWGSPPSLSCKNTTKGLQCQLKGRFYVQNKGQEDVPGSFSFDVAFFLSDDKSLFSGPDFLLKQVSVKGLAVGENGGQGKPIDLNVTLTSSVDPATQYVLAFVDSKDVILETNETNNLIVYPDCPYALTVDVKPAGAGWVTRSPDKSAYCSGEKVTLTANANSTASFFSWDGVDSSSGATATVTMNADRTVTAHFRDIGPQPCHSTLTITVNPPNSGTVTADPAASTYCPKDRVTLTPAPMPGYVLDSWAGTDSNTLVTTVTMKNSRKVTANFVPAPKTRVDAELVSDGTGGNSSNCEIPNRKESFLTSDPFAVLYLKFSNIPTYSTMSYSFYRPDTNLYESGSQNWYDSSKCGYVCWAAKLLIAGRAAASAPGLWWVNWSYNDGVNSLSGSEHFTICAYSISPLGQSFPSWGGTGSVDVKATSVCGWTAASNVPWITITSAHTGVMGNGTVNYSVLANPGSSSRTGTLTIAGQTFTLSQGGNWKLVTLPTLLAEWDLSAVAFPSPDEGWAVGADYVYHEGVLLHYSGGQWSSVTPPVLPEHWGLSAVHFSSPGEGYAVGAQNRKGVLLRYSSGTWKSIDPPSQNLNWELNGVYLPPGQGDMGWAVGHSYDDTLDNGGGVLLYSSSGDTWKSYTPPWVSTFWGLNSVHFSSGSEGWAAGYKLMGGHRSGICLRYDCFGGLKCDTNASNWWENASLPSPPNDWELNSVYSLSRQEAWAVGDANGRGVLLHYAGKDLYQGDWSLVDPPVVSGAWGLNSVYFSSPDDGWAVGEDFENHRGVLLHYDGQRWASVDPPSVSLDWWLGGVYFSSSGERWAVGGDNVNRRGVLLHLAPVPAP